MINTGSRVPGNLIPPGYGGKSAGHAKGHLLGKQLGGDGKVPSNVVTLFQDPVNNRWMRARYEDQVRSWLDAGRNVMYTSKPLYSGSNVIPSGVWITAYSNDGRAFSVAIPNVRP